MHQDVVDLDLVQEAVYTEPNDQSMWIYHRWVMETRMIVSKQKAYDFSFLVKGFPSYNRILLREIDRVKELLEIEPNSKCKRWLRCFLKSHLGCLLTLLFLGRLLPADKAIDRSQTELWLKKLKEVDPTHMNFYNEFSD